MTKTKEEKEEFENVKKTAKAHGTLDEATAESKAGSPEEVATTLIDNVDDDSELSDEEKENLRLKKERKEKIDSMGRHEDLTREQKSKVEALSVWEPKTKLGQEVKNGKIVNIDDILDGKRKILEEQIVDILLNLKSDLISIGQAKGKFGGGKRRAWRQTQKKTKEGNIAVFSTMAVVGDENGHVGIGMGRAKETLPARAKAERKARLNIIKIRRGCASFDCNCSELHTVPFKVEGKMGSVRVILTPAPQGTGLVAGNELKKVLKLAGIKDVYAKTFGKIRTTFNLIGACFNALEKTNTKTN